MIAIHQSQFIPWVPYFYKILNSDIFVQLDDVQFQKNGLQNRNQIKTSAGRQWLTLPVKQHLENQINQVELFNPSKNITKILKTINQNYQKSEFFNDVNEIWEFLEKKETSNLLKTNNYLLNDIITKLDYKGEMKFSSSLNTASKKDDLVIEIIKKLGGNDYLTGKGALNYMNLKKFKENKISVYVLDFTYSEYRQLWSKKIGFVPELSIVDLLYNNLENARKYIFSNGNIKKIV